MTQSYSQVDRKVALPVERGRVDGSEVIAELAVPTDEFVLEETLRAAPDAEFEFEQVVASGDRSVTPLLEVRAEDYEALEEALSEDPSVEDVSSLATFDTKRLYRVRWTSHARLFVETLTTAEATILDLTGTKSGWNIRLLYPSREHLSTAFDVCEARSLTPDLQVVSEADDEDWSGTGLTSKQFESLCLAYEWGYYEVPTETTLEEMAAELDVSHQALSERLRRAQDILIEEALFPGAASTQ